MGIQQINKIFLESNASWTSTDECESVSNGNTTAS